MKLLRSTTQKRRSRLSSIASSIAIAAVASTVALTPLSSKAELGGLLYLQATGSGDNASRPLLSGDMGSGYFPSTSTSVFSNVTSQPQAMWINGSSSQGSVASYVHAALVQKQMPALVVYNLYKRDCNQQSAGGTDTPDQYLRWIDGVAAEIAAGVNQAIQEGAQINDVNSTTKPVPILIMLEPDSMALAPSTDPRFNAAACWDSNGPLFDADARWQTVAQAVLKLASAAQSAPVCDPQQDFTGKLYRPSTCSSWQSQIRIYLDAAHSAWTRGWPMSEIVRRLDLAGMKSAAGFFTNSSNYQLLANEVAYGQDIASALDAKYATQVGGCGAHPCAIPKKKQIIDSGRSGADVSTGLYVNGDIHQEYQTNNWPSWCDNQKGRIGHAPTAHPQYWPELRGYDQLDALLWIKRPGETDGCWGGPATTVPNTTPKFSDQVIDRWQIDGQGKYFLAPAPWPAGWDSWLLACGLVEGAYYHPAYDHLPPSLCSNGYMQTVLPPPLPPTDVRITDFTMVALGAAADTITLEWEPSRYACFYMISARTSIDNRNWSAWRQVNSNFIGPAAYGTGAPTRFVISPPVHGRYVQYGVRARKCDDVGTTYSSYGYTAYSTVVLFP